MTSTPYCLLPILFQRDARKVNGSGRKRNLICPGTSRSNSPSNSHTWCKVRAGSHCITCITCYGVNVFVFICPGKTYKTSDTVRFPISPPGLQLTLDSCSLRFWQEQMDNLGDQHNKLPRIWPVFGGTTIPPHNTF